MSNALSGFLKENGANYLLTFLSIGPIKIHLGQEPDLIVKNFDEFVDFFRRMQTPYYEEARTKFQDSNILDDYSDANEAYPYQPHVLKKIIVG